MPLVALIFFLAISWFVGGTFRLAWRTARAFIMWLYWSIEEHLIERDCQKKHGFHMRVEKPSSPPKPNEKIG